MHATIITLIYLLLVSVIFLLFTIILAGISSGFVSAMAEAEYKMWCTMRKFSCVFIAVLLVVTIVACAVAWFVP